MLRAQFGSQLTEYDLVIHNTIVEKTKDILNVNPYITDEALVNELNTYYKQYKVEAQTSSSIGLL